MSGNLRAVKSVQKILYRSTHKRCLYPSSGWGFQCVTSRHYSSQDDKSNTNGSFAKYGIGLLAAFGALFAAYQFDVIPNFGNEDKDPDSKKKPKRPAKVFKYPKDSSHIPDYVPYLLIGGGTASFSAFRAIKSADPTARVLIIGNEPYNPYMRPPLSKELFYNEDRSLAKNLKFKQWNASERSLFYEPEDFYTPVETLFPLEAKDNIKDEPKAVEKENNTDKATESGAVEAKSEKAVVANNGNGGISVVRGWKVTGLDATQKVATLEDGHQIRFDKCLLATGAAPRNLPVFSDPQLAPRVTLYRGVEDFQRLESVIESGGGGKKVAVVGGGFLGSELSCALAKRGANSNTRVYQIFREKGNMARVLPEYLSAWTTNKVQEEGVHTLPDVTIQRAESSGTQVELNLSDGQKLSVDHVVVAVGVEPNTQLAKVAGLETDPLLGGYLVNSELAARSNIYAAGDCACFYDPSLGRRRVEHHDHAVQSGRLAGENMTGANKHYVHQSMFWSDLGPEVGYEAIGLVDSTLPTVGVYAKADEANTAVDAAQASGTAALPSPDSKNSKPESAVASKDKSSSKQSSDYGKGVIFYLRDDIVVGIVLWNVFNRMAIARQVLKSERKYEDLNEVAKLFNIHAE